MLVQTDANTGNGDVEEYLPMQAMKKESSIVQLYNQKSNECLYSCKIIDSFGCPCLLMLSWLSILQPCVWRYQEGCAWGQ